jgi:hypothetical protein
MLADLYKLAREVAAKPTEAAPDARTTTIGRVPTEAAWNYPRTWEIANSTASLNAVLTARQVGKTSSARLISRLGMAKPGHRTIYATLIRRNCKKLFWRPLLAELAKDGWGVHERDEHGRKASNDTDLVLEAPNGSWLQAVSCKTMADLETIRGDQCDVFIVDEAQEPNDEVIEALIFKIALAMLLRRNGRLWVMGTVPEYEPTVFTKLIDSPKWQTFGHSPAKGTKEITVYDNPFMDPAVVKAKCEEAGLLPGHPVYEREMMGRRVKDPSKLAYEYLEGRNDYDPTDVSFGGDDLGHAGGLDLGFQDRDAITVGSWRDTDAARRLWVRWQWQHNHLDVDDLADVMAVVMRIFPDIRWCGDHGGHGAVKVLQTIGNRMRIGFLPKPADVMVSVGFVNDDYRTARLLLPTLDIVTPLLLAEVDRMPWDDRRKERVRQLIATGARGASIAEDAGKVTKTLQNGRVVINKKGFHSDLTESKRYMHHAARHYRAEAPPPPAQLTDDQKREIQIREQLALWEQQRKKGRWS